MGDFNIDYRANGNSEFKNLMSVNGFKQLVKSATRITKESSTLIDLIFVNKPQSYSNINVVATSLSDHDLISCTRKINAQRFPSKTIQCRDYSNYDSDLLINDIGKINWEPIYDSNDVNDAVQYLTNELNNVFNIHAPLIKKRVRGKPCPWIDDSIKREMNKRDSLLRRARSLNNELSWNDYKKQRNKCTNLVRKAKATYTRNLLNDNRLNPGKFWNIIKSIFPTKSKSLAKNVADTKYRVQNFAKYFSNIVANLKAAAYPLTNFTWRYPEKSSLRTKSIFKFTYVSTVFIKRELRRLKRKKAPGVDCLPPNLLKDSASVIASPIAHIINLSLRTSTVPNLWKIAKICPIFKSGNSDLVENYRPISILPILSKLLEKSVHKQLYEYLESHKLISDCQFGFRKNRSTKLATMLFCDKIRKHVDNGNMVGSLFLDLTKAFDTIGHGVLLEKLILYGVGGSELSWLKDYLFHRSHFVEINNVVSETHFITSGVPQGSILGPLLFIIFFNDLEENVGTNCEIFQYADDTVVLFADKNVQHIENVLNKSMEQIGQYCFKNEMLLNLKKGKTEVMLFGTAQRLNRHGKELAIFYNDACINFVTEYVYLGNLLDNHLLLSSNFERAYKKACGRFRLLNNVRKNLTSEATELIFKMMVVPILTYSSTIKTTYTTTQQRKLKSLERRAKIITGKSVKPINTILKDHVCSLVVKCLKKEFCHEVLDDYFNIQNHVHRTRNNEHSIMLPSIKLEFARSSFYYGGAKIFNSLSLDNRKALLS